MTIALVALLVLSMSPDRATVAQASDTTVTFSSDSTWQVADSSSLASLGNAQLVCLHDWDSGCLQRGGVSYGFPGQGGWSANLSSIPGAAWIWAPGVTGSTYPADLKAFTFTKEFELQGQPTAGTISIAADDYAEVYVNNQFVGKLGSIDDVRIAAAAQASLATFDITSFLRSGTNVIAVRAQNGPASFAGCSSGCTYSQNTAGVVFGDSLASVNHSPTADAGGPYTVPEGGSARLTGSGSDADGDPLTYTWDLDGDGLFETPGQSVSYSAAGLDGPVTKPITFRVCDAWMACSVVQADVAVTNVAPTVGTLTIGGATGTACLAGNAVTLDFGFSDPGQKDSPWTVDIDWGDGSTHATYASAAQGAQPQQSHSYGAGSYTIGVMVTDKDVGKGTAGTAAGTVSHLYSMTGILQPFNSDGSSVWKYGSAIPVKVQITDCHDTPVPDLAPKVGTSLVSSSDPTVPIDEVASTSAADTTGQMRYDSAAGQYVYNFASQGLADSSATYYMTVKGTDSNGDLVTSPSLAQVKFGVRTK